MAMARGNWVPQTCTSIQGMSLLLALGFSILLVNAAELISPPRTVPPGLEHPPSPGLEQRETIAHRILGLEREVNGSTNSAAAVLNQVLDALGEAAQKIKRRREDRWDPHYAETVLRAIDARLIELGFLYPDTGAVDLLTDCFTPFQMDAARRTGFQWRSENLRRMEMLAKRFPGPFYTLDCDTACFLYLSVAERLRWPLFLVVVPSRDRRPGHAFVRWREGTRSVNWETTEGVIRSDEAFVKSWNISPSAIRTGAAMTELTLDQALGCAHYLVGVRYERQGNADRALREFTRALELHPENLDARREFAWVSATAPELKTRDHATATRHILHVLEQMEDPDARDTLAAVHASAGRFEQAVREELKAIRNGTASAKPGFRQRLELYREGKAYRTRRRF